MEVLKISRKTDRPDALSEHRVWEIRRRLRSTGHHVLRTIEFEYGNGVVVLRGRVPSYYLKQLAQSVLLSNPLAEKIVNLIVVSENIGKLPSLTRD
jgi:hypothetical protein